MSRKHTTVAPPSDKASLKGVSNIMSRKQQLYSSTVRQVILKGRKQTNQLLDLLNYLKFRIYLSKI